MNDITLGKCPFCGGKVSSAVESRHKAPLSPIGAHGPSAKTAAPLGGWRTVGTICTSDTAATRSGRGRDRPRRQMGRRLRDAHASPPMPALRRPPCVRGGQCGPVLRLSRRWARQVRSGHDPARAGRQVERRGGRGRERRKTPGRTGEGTRNTEPRLLAGTAQERVAPFFSRGWPPNSSTASLSSFPRPCPP